jgi:hypothetical protein
MTNDQDLDEALIENVSLKQEILALKQQLRSQQSPEAKPWSQYQQLKKDNPSEYFKASTQIQMDRDAQAMGADFFDTGPATNTRAHQAYTGDNAIHIDDDKRQRLNK